MTWLWVGVAAAVIASAIIVRRQRALKWSALFAELRRRGFRPLGKAQGQWHLQKDGLSASVRPSTREFGVQGAELAQRLPTVRRRRYLQQGAPAYVDADGPLSMDPALDLHVRLQSSPAAVLTMPRSSRQALRLLLELPNLTQANGSATTWRWEAEWPPAGAELDRFLVALEAAQAWAAQAHPATPEPIRLLRAAQSDEPLWVRQMCLLQLEAQEPGLAATASWQTSAKTVTEAINALAELPDEQVPRSWRRAVVERLLAVLSPPRRAEALRHAIRSGSVATSRFLIHRALKPFPEGPLPESAEALVCEGLRHRSGTIQLLAAQTLAERGSPRALPSIQTALEASVFRTPDNEMWARTAITRIRGRSQELSS